MVAQPKVDNFVALPSVQEELTGMRQALPEDKLIVLEGERANLVNVTRALGKATWIHFACHGHQEQGNPLESCLVLSDGKLMIDSMIANRFENADSFAFLSACHTARGLPELPDEMLHITAALQCAGFGAVVGSAWAIADKDAPSVASRFYRYLMNQGGELDPTKTADALRVAITALRRSGVPAHRWAPFLHVGI
ncbi:hypothetical protein DACRYDRAFT_21189 [Dacryopinax primogenitus]|uniref:CHAT domain-containing protein n=1 Tax=Dacryopinax primogenitus (strain DJM 731) TaxID=1858805 RepID=M5G0C6_DACPD|nr:uncharacterized protein DACRYDRAFT_21189 [Dacryopinax primogenitus]EJU03691.1 hypothetical protein DACRYDRAFT_21189 [Dacryopinax primogenitus]